MAASASTTPTAHLTVKELGLANRYVTAYLSGNAKKWERCLSGRMNGRLIRNETDTKHTRKTFVEHFQKMLFPHIQPDKSIVHRFAWKKEDDGTVVVELSTTQTHDFGGELKTSTVDDTIRMQTRKNRRGHLKLKFVQHHYRPHVAGQTYDATIADDGRLIRTFHEKK